MAAVNVAQVIPGNCQVEFTAPFSFSIEYECIHPLQDDLEWKMIYVGSAESETHDQLLDTVFVGPVLQGAYKFVFEGDAPDISKIPADDLLGVTVVLITCSYKGNEFVRVGYYVNVEYSDQELRENPPEVPILAALSRSISLNPRVTRYPIEFDNDALPGVAAAVSEDVVQDIAMDEGPMQEQGNMIMA